MPVDYPRVRFTLAAMLFIVTSATLITFLGGKRVIAAHAEMMRQQDVIQVLTATFSALNDAETGQRGYLLTGDKSYLQPYDRAATLIPVQLNALREHADRGVIDQAKVAELDVLVKEKLEELKRTIEVRERQGLPAAMMLVQGGEGKGTMDRIRTAVDADLRVQQQRLQTLQERAAWATFVRTSIFAACGGLEVLFCIWAYRRIVAEMRRFSDASTALRQQKDLLSVTLGSIGDAVMVCDLEAQVTFMNPMAEKLTGWTQAEAHGKPLPEIFRIINEDSRQTVESPVDKVFRLGQVVGLANHTLLIRKDGTELPIDDSGAPIRDEQGKIYGVVLIFRDFSEHKAAEKEMLKARADAEASSRAKDQFLATLSHELRTPLTPVAATLNMWDADESVPESLKRDIKMMRRNIDLEARLIDDLLDLTRITKGKLSLNLEPADLHDLLTSVVSIVRADAAARKIKITLDLHSPHHHAEGDPARLQQVMWNLLKNAIKFTPEGGQILVETREEDDGRVTFLVKDSGIGISQDSIPRLFRPFEQGSGTAGRYGGLGLGLAIAKALVEAQGGMITAQSDGPGRGSTFAVTFPATEPPSPVEAPDAARLHPAGPRSRVLLVEDHADSAHALARIIAGFGHDVHVAGSVGAALKLFDEQKFDLLVSDLGLPDGSGLDLIRQIRARRPIPALALTGFGMEDDVARCLEAGFAAHLTKPVNFQKLEATLANIMEAGAA
jgi:PAS domain S-box-containing protein